MVEYDWEAAGVCVGGVKDQKTCRFRTKVATPIS